MKKSLLDGSDLERERERERAALKRAEGQRSSGSQNPVLVEGPGVSSMKRPI